MDERRQDILVDLALFMVMKYMTLTLSGIAKNVRFEQSVEFPGMQLLYNTYGASNQKRLRESLL